MKRFQSSSPSPIRNIATDTATMFRSSPRNADTRARRMPDPVTGNRRSMRGGSGLWTFLQPAPHLDVLDHPALGGLERRPHGRGARSPREDQTGEPEHQHHRSPPEIHIEPAERSISLDITVGGESVAPDQEPQRAEQRAD